MECVLSFRGKQKSYDSSLKRGYIEFKYYADAIHSDLTPARVNNSWTVGLTKAEVSPSVFTLLSLSVFTPHQILYSPSLNDCTVHGFCIETSISVPLRLHFISAVSRESVSTGVCLRDPVYKQRFFVARDVRHLQAFILVQLCNKLAAGILTVANIWICWHNARATKYTPTNWTNSVNYFFLLIKLSK